MLLQQANQLEGLLVAACLLAVWAAWARCDH
jgi:hypothetical protein